MKMKVEIRDNSVVLDGYVNVVARDSRVLPSVRGKFIEQMMPTVFQRALDKTDNVDLLFNHKNERKLGSTSEGNLKLYEDSIGLRAIATVSDPEVIEKAKNNELRGWSFGFIANQDKWEDGEEVQRRYVSDIDLLEVSILSVTPAYIATSIEARGDEEVIKELRRGSSYSHKDNEDDEDDEDTFGDNGSQGVTTNDEPDDPNNDIDDDGDNDTDFDEINRSFESLSNYLAIKR